MLDRVKRALRAPKLATAPASQPGLTHYPREHDGKPVRYHLRVEPDGSGLLLANAAAAVRLSQSGVMIAQGLLAGDDSASLARALKRRFSVGAAQLKEDMDAVRKVIAELADPGGRYPLSSLDAGASVHRRSLGAALAADVTAGGDMDAALAILDKLWEATVPQAVLSLPPRGDASQLVRLVERAEDLGLIAGVRARAGDLGADGLLDELAQAGLDHVDLFYAGDEAHDALFGAGDHAAACAMLARARTLEICPVAVVPLVATTFDALEALGDALAAMEVVAVTFFALVSDAGDGVALSADQVRQAAADAEELADHHGFNLVWAPPLERDPDVDAGAQIQRGPRTAGEASMRVEPDGAVIPAEGPYQRAGNLLSDRWARIWAHAAFRRYREAIDEPERCDACPGLVLCGAGCPAQPITWARLGRGGDR